VRVDHTVAATAIAALPFAEAMRAHFAPMRDSYNAAVRGERIAPLAAGELPFWKLDRATTSRAALLEGDAANLVAPRALTLTALARLVLCDEFIHGTGGGHYDLAMERWIAAAFGDDARAALAPMSVVTATKPAPLARFVPEFDEAATPEALRALEQDPFNDDGATKRALRAAITGPRAEKRTAYLAMRRAIVEARAARATELASMRTRSRTTGPGRFRLRYGEAWRSDPLIYAVETKERHDPQPVCLLGATREMSAADDRNKLTVERGGHRPRPYLPIR
jgi:hypothetical protein